MKEKQMKLSITQCQRKTQTRARTGRRDERNTHNKIAKNYVKSFANYFCFIHTLFLKIFSLTLTLAKSSKFKGFERIDREESVKQR